MQRSSCLRRIRPGRTAGLGLSVGSLVGAGGASGGGVGGSDLLGALMPLIQPVLDWYHRTPAIDRLTWGGLAACALLAVIVLLERSWRLRRGRVMPSEFSGRWLERLSEGKFDRLKGLDFCELNPSPAARVALAAVRRWGRPTADLERAVALACRVEVDRLRRNVGTLRRVAALAPMIGLLGALLTAGRILAGADAATPLGPALAPALGPVTAGVALAILALVAYDGLVGRVEKLAHALDRLGAQTVDAIAMSRPAEPGFRSNPRSDPDLGSASPAPRSRRSASTPHQGRDRAPQRSRSAARHRDDDLDLDFD